MHFEEAKTWLPSGSCEFLDVFANIQSIFTTNQPYSSLYMESERKSLVPNDRAIVNVQSDDAKVWCSGGSWGFLGAFHMFSAIFFTTKQTYPLR